MVDNLKKRFDELTLLMNSESSINKKQNLAKEQIKILKKIQEKFLHIAQEKGYSLNSYNVLDIKLQQYKLMRQIAEINKLPIEEYEKLIIKTKQEIFGE